MDETQSRHRPDYPPKSPPPPKRPVEPARPDPPTTPAPQKTATPAQRRPAAFIRNRRAVNWGLENAPWSPGKASRYVVDQLTSWGYCGTERQRDQAAAVTRALATAALADGGKRVSVHLADQDGHALIMVLSHRADTVPSEAFLTEISALGVASCGSDVNRDDAGNQRWALIAL